MIVLVNPWSTPSPKKPLPMSLLALGSMLEGEFDYRIVDGNVEADPVGAGFSPSRRRRASTAMAVTVMPGRSCAPRRCGCRALKTHAAGRADRLGRLLSRRSMPRRACANRRVDYLRSRAGRAHLPRGDARAARWRPARRRLPASATVSMGAVQRTRRSRRWRRSMRCRRGRTTAWRWSATFIAHYLGHRVGAHHSSFGCPFACNFCAVVGMANRNWVAESPERVGAVLEKFRLIYGADAVQFHDMDFFISRGPHARRSPIACDRAGSDMVGARPRRRADALQGHHVGGDEAQRPEDDRSAAPSPVPTDTLQRMNKGGTATADLTLELARRAKIVRHRARVLVRRRQSAGSRSRSRADAGAHPAISSRLTSASASSSMSIRRCQWTAFSTRQRAMQGSASRTRSRAGSAIGGSRLRCAAIRARPGRTAKCGGRCATLKACSTPTIRAPMITHLTPGRRRVLRAASAWRYHAKTYARPLELNFLLRAFRYERPETIGH